MSLIRLRSYCLKVNKFIVIMDLGISGKKAIICASSRGLGKACAESLASEGVEIFINGVQEKNLKKTEEEFKKAKQKLLN